MLHSRSRIRLRAPLRLWQKCFALPRGTFSYKKCLKLSNNYEKSQNMPINGNELYRRALERGKKWTRALSPSPNSGSAPVTISYSTPSSGSGAWLSTLHIIFHVWALKTFFTRFTCYFSIIFERIKASYERCTADAYNTCFNIINYSPASGCTLSHGTLVIFV